MRVYISSHDPIAANLLAEELLNAGHVIVSTWHFEDRPEVTGPEWWASRAAENFGRIQQAEALVLIGGTDRYPGGKYVEAGYANGQGIQVYNLGEVGNGMMHFAEHASDITALIAALEEAR